MSHATGRRVAIALAAAVVACTGGGDPAPAVGDGGTSSSSSGAQAIFSGRLEARAGNTCPGAGPIVSLGSFNPPQPIPDGRPLDPGVAVVKCRVRLAGAGFDVTATVGRTAEFGGLDFEGFVTSTGTQTIVLRRLTPATGGSYDETDRKCTLTYPSPLGGIAAGRLWGEILCPNVTRPGGESCSLVATVRLESCLQQ